MTGRLAIIFGILFLGQNCMAQAPAGAPAGTTGLCNDGTYFTGATKSGACRGHKGLKTWYGAPPSANSNATQNTPAKSASNTASDKAPSNSTATPAPAAASASKPSAATPKNGKTQAPGGGPGLVWLNTASNTYHCPGTQYYGKTKAGSYMSEADAKAKGAHPDHGKPCK
jgi:hypothetical protein